MKKSMLFALAMTCCAVLVTACGGSSPKGGAGGNSSGGSTSPEKTLRAFGSDQELAGYLRQLAEEQRRGRRQQGKSETDAIVPAAAQAAPAAAAGAAESVTNVQHAGVDEGGIVKLHGDYLVVLRRGRLFTVAVGDAALKPVSVADAFGTDIDPSGTWYDEMLIAGDTVAVVGYSYQRGGTEIGLFDIDAAGRLAYRATYHLRSNDYYSSRNYASRLVGSTLIFYTPLRLSLANAGDPFADFPALRRWHPGATNGEFQRIASSTRVFRPERPLNVSAGLALHTVTTCDLARRELACEATVVMGPPGRVFYASPGSVYVWASEAWRGRGQAPRDAMLVRMRLDGSAPSALGVSGSPVDQFSFLESEDGHLNVLVRSEAAGDGMWSAEVAAGDVALLRVPLSSLSDGSGSAPASSYRALPRPAGGAFENRFVGDYLLYGTGSGWGRPARDAWSSLYAVPWRGGEPAELSLVHGVDRIEVMGADAVVVGTDGTDLHFTGVRLGGRPAVVSRYTRAGASQGELRSHGFFYRADGADSGLLGLPIRGPGRPGYEHLFRDSASILFLRNDALQLSELGELDARAEGAVSDGCRASCVDWYGNARPLFVRGRVFALLGYEIVEGSVSGNRIQEIRRVSFAPGNVPGWR